MFGDPHGGSSLGTTVMSRDVASEGHLRFAFDAVYHSQVFRNPLIIPPRAVRTFLLVMARDVASEGHLRFALDDSSGAVHCGSGK